MQNSEQQLAGLIARAAIENQLGIYCRAIDRLDTELLKTVYHPDAIDDHGAIVANAWEFAEQITVILRQVCIYSQHSVMHSVIDIEGDKAFSESTYMGFHTIAADQTAIASFFGDAYLSEQQAAGCDNREHEYICGGRYLDKWERRGGEWKILHRKMTNEWNICRPASAASGGMAASFSSPGCRDGSDPVFSFLQR